MKYSEEALLFAQGCDTLVGVLTQPERPAPLAVLVIVGGPQYRAGSHRQFVHLARTLAERGYAVLRFDVRGMGDSCGAPRDFESIGGDIGEGIDALLSNCAPDTRVVLWGLCDAAAAALLYLDERNDARVAGLCLLNPWVRSQAGLARTRVRHYYLQRLGQKEFWSKLLTGRVHADALVGLARNLRLARSWNGDASGTESVPFQERMARGWSRFSGRTLLLLSGDDYTAKEFVEFAAGRSPWRQLLAGAHVDRHELPGADHTFSNASHQDKIARQTADWLQGVAQHA
ncbi:MAG: hydrolase 1, exosortase A system-associated [Ramlibacter sp.]|nr:hydrolase 1, exosortase A system-associated [Ramlibacter sp.]